MESHEHNREQHENLLHNNIVFMLFSVMLMGLHAAIESQKKAFVYVKSLTQLLVYSPVSLTEQEPNVCFETEITPKRVTSTKCV